MGTLYKNIVSLCEERGIKPGRMCNEAGISRGLITDLKMDRKSDITLGTAQKIADYFGVTIDRVLGSDQKEKSPAPDGVGLTETQQKAWDLIQGMDEESLKKFIVIAQTVKGDL